MRGSLLCRVVAIGRAALIARRPCHAENAIHRVHDYYFSYFREADGYRTVAHSNPDLRMVVSSKAVKQLSPTSLSNAELVEVVLCCAEITGWRRWRRDIESECVRRAASLPFVMSVAVMDAWAAAFGGKVYLREMLPRWSCGLHTASKSDFIHLVYLASLGKRAPDVFVRAVLQRLHMMLQDSKLRELGVICSSLFKLKVKTKDTLILDAVARCTEHNIAADGDRFDIIAALKFLRLCEHHDARLLTQLAVYVEKNAGNFMLVECAHFLAAFSSVGAYDEATFRKLERKFTALLHDLRGCPGGTSKTHPSDAPRVKDVAKVLWAFASVGHNADSDSLDAATEFLEDHFTVNSALHVLDAVQSLICLNTYPLDLIQKVISQHYLQKIVTMSQKAKPLKQLLFVKSSASIMIDGKLGNPGKYPGPAKPDSTQFARDGFKVLADLLAASGLSASYVLPHIRIASFAFSVCPESYATATINFANLRGAGSELPLSQDLIDAVSGKRGSCHGKISSFATLPPSATIVNIELIDDSVLLKDSNTAMRGIMKAKLRQLRRLGLKVVLVTPQEVQSITELQGESRVRWREEFLKRCVNDAIPEFYNSSDCNSAVFGS